MDKIRKNDEVIVIAGKDKGKRGVVQQRVDAEHVVVEGVNVVKKAHQAEPDDRPTGGIVDKTMPIHVSNVALFNPATGKADRVGFKDVDGNKVRFFKSNGEVSERVMSNHGPSPKVLQGQSRRRADREVRLQVGDGGAAPDQDHPEHGLGEAVADKKIIENAVGDMTKIAGQKPVVTKARKAIAGFKIREG